LVVAAGGVDYPHTREKCCALAHTRCVFDTAQRAAKEGITIAVSFTAYHLTGTT